MNTSSERVATGEDEWLSPPNVITALVEFDPDPCVLRIRPWDIAKADWTAEDEIVSKLWYGRSWCNLLYGSETCIRLQELSKYSNGTNLIFARTVTGNFFQYIGPRASGMMLFRGRLVLRHADWTTRVRSSGVPTCLVVYRDKNAKAPRNGGLRDKPIIHTTDLKLNKERR